MQPEARTWELDGCRVGAEGAPGCRVNVRAPGCPAERRRGRVGVGTMDPIILSTAPIRDYVQGRHGPNPQYHLEFLSRDILAYRGGRAPLVDLDPHRGRATQWADIPIIRRGGTVEVLFGRRTGIAYRFLRSEEDLVSFLYRMRYLHDRFRGSETRLEGFTAFTRALQLGLRRTTLRRWGERLIAHTCSLPPGLEATWLEETRRCAAYFLDMNTHLAYTLRCHYPVALGLHTPGELQAFAHRVWSQHTRRLALGARQGLFGSPPDWPAWYAGLQPQQTLPTPLYQNSFAPWPESCPGELRVTLHPEFVTLRDMAPWSGSVPPYARW